MGRENPKYSVKGFYVACQSREFSQSTLLSSIGVAEPKRKKQYSFAFPDLESMIQNLEDACNEYDRMGYDIESVIPLNIGSSDEYLNSNNSVVTTSAYSVTRGAMIVAKRRDDN